MKVLITGASGFVGSALVQTLLAKGGVDVVGAYRSGKTAVPVGVTQAWIDAIDDKQDWHSALNGVDAIVHCAARVHVMAEAAVDPLAEFRRINVAGTLHLARQAAAAGVGRFIFVSSIGVNGRETFGLPFSDADQAKPIGAYAQSKHEAELALKALAAESKMEVVIIRPPLVYGPNAPGNFGSLLRWLGRGVPLPLGSIRNARSIVALDNLVDLLATCLTHPAAANQTFLVSDGEDVSTTELLRRMGQALGRPARLLPVPASWLRLAAGLLGKGDVAQRLCGSLQVDIEKTRRVLGWSPPVSLDQGLRKAAEGLKS